MVGTRPDRAFSVGRLAQYVEEPTKDLWTMLKRVMRYGSGTRDTGIPYRWNADFELRGYSKSDHAGCKINRKSTSGFSFILAGGAVCWMSKKQSCVARSSSEAEYMAAGRTTQEKLWLSRLYAMLLGKYVPEPIVLHMDNQGSIDMAKNDSNVQRTKHIDVQYHFVRDCVAKGVCTNVRDAGARND